MSIPQGGPAKYQDRGKTMFDTAYDIYTKPLILAYLLMAASIATIFLASWAAASLNASILNVFTLCTAAAGFMLASTSTYEDLFRPMPENKLSAMTLTISMQKCLENAYRYERVITPATFHACEDYRYIAPEEVSFLITE